MTIQRIDSSLHQTVWRLAEPDARTAAIVLLEDGEGWIEGAGRVAERVQGPALLWRARAEGRRFRAEAGSTGYAGSIGEAYLAQLGADYADAPILSFVAGRDHDLPLLAPGDLDLPGILAALHRELQTPRVGSPIILAAQVRILLVGMLRLSGLEGALEGSGSGARFLQLFRELVEAHFRARWPVRRYAEAIGISHDRLHGLCTRRLGRTPKDLIAERVAREATLGLERSTLSLEQLSYTLGFRDPAHFSHFFKRVTGMSPGAYRRMAGSTRERPIAGPPSFADWP